ncbi:hypothetical protein [Chryseobacterium polytrichastri]|uniref:Uncharacterized protein n=1 Tax=Chryseobacterium polytrichastri TaxID=1302687 RepID=A0A1M7BR93_9FLAO|nr:hypothetical protein [Chryseobacterium polytrichastri]SHL57474.1 hypothetical protein SAMN05444267_102058 [Chryseobacterium polytrichastri]
MTTIDENILKNGSLPTGFNDSINLMSKSFVAHESVVIDIVPIKCRDTLKAIILENENKQSARFLWQKNSVPDGTVKTGYFKETVNELGVTIAHNEGSITITNGGASQYLKAELKV